MQQVYHLLHIVVHWLRQCSRCTTCCNKYTSGLPPLVVICCISGVPPEMQHKMQQVYHLLHKSTSHNRRLWLVVVAFFLLTAKGGTPFACANRRFANENEGLLCGLSCDTTTMQQKLCCGERCSICWTNQ